MNARPASAPLSGRWMLAWWIVVAAGLGLQMWWAVANVPGIQWNPARVAVPFALGHGLPIYALRDSGLQLGWFYGPMFPLWYAPVTWLGNITAILVGAAVVNVFTYLLPVVWVLRVAGLRERVVTGVTLAAVLFLGHAVSHRNFFFIHVDVLCLLFSVGACVSLACAVDGKSRWAWHAAAIALALACWTKQLAVALYPAVLAWLWWERGAKETARFGLFAATYAALASLVVFAWFGAEEVLFNTVMVHLRNPAEDAVTLGGRGWELLRGSAAWLPIVALWLVLRRDGPALPLRAARLVRLFIIVALVQLPLGLSAALKSGGGLNSIHAQHFLGLALIVVVLHPLAARRLESSRLVATVWLIAAIAPLAYSVVLTREGNPVWTLSRRNEELVRMARAEPAKFYFPWNPLATLVAEGRVQPADNALFCLWLAGLEPPVEKIRASVPARPVIIYDEPAQSTFALKYFRSVNRKDGER